VLKCFSIRKNFVGHPIAAYRTAMVQISGSPATAAHPANAGFALPTLSEITTAVTLLLFSMREAHSLGFVALA